MILKCFKGFSKICVKKLFLRFFCRDHLLTDMKDSHLKFWTTNPNVFLVAITEESKKVVGCISYREISPNTGIKQLLILQICCLI